MPTPLRKRLRMRHVRQERDVDCGYAAVASLLSCYGRFVSIDALAERQPFRNGMGTLREIRSLLRSQGFHAVCYEVRHFDILDREMYPLIAHTRSDHYVAIDRRIGPLGRIADPGRGIRWRILATQPLSGFVVRAQPIIDLPTGGPRPEVRLSRILHYSLRPLALILGLSLAAGLLALVFSQLLRVFVDLLDAGHEQPLREIAATCTFGVIVAITLGVVRFVVSIISFSGGIEVERRIGRAYGVAMVQAPVGFLRRHAIGDLVSRYRDIELVREYTHVGTVSLAMGLATALTGAVALCVLSPVVGALSIMLSVSGGIAAWVAGRYTESLQFDAVAGEGDFTNVLVETFSSAAERRSAAGWDHLARTLSMNQEKLHALRKRTFTRASALVTAVSTWENACYSAVLAVAAAAVASGSISLGALMSFAILVPIVNSGVGEIVSFQQSLQAAKAAADRVSMVADREVHNVNVGASSAVTDQSITFLRGGNVVLAANRLELRIQGSTVFQLSRFHLTPGEMVGLVGANGSGKTSLCQVLAGLEVGWSGSLELAGMPAGRASVSDLASIACYVPGAVSLHSGSIRENILLGRDEPGDFQWLLDVTGVAALAQRFPDGLDTLIGRQGVRLSAGQSQRLGIARALICPRSILLLDESLAAVTHSDSAQMIGAIRRRYRSMAIVLVAHDVRMADLCDRVVMMAGGGEVLV